MNPVLDIDYFCIDGTGYCTVVLYSTDIYKYIYYYNIVWWFICK